MQTWLERFANAVFSRSSDTAHDLKTPINIAVLNLELLRMRLRKVTGSDDVKIDGYTRAIDLELRRLASTFDAFFVYTVPPVNEGPPLPVDFSTFASEECSRLGIPLQIHGDISVWGHPARIRTLMKLLLEGFGRIAKEPTARLQGVENGTSLVLAGLPASELELGKIFKFYYTDASGNPELSLATSRLIAETYGGVLTASLLEGRIVVELAFQGEK